MKSHCYDFSECVLPGIGMNLNLVGTKYQTVPTIFHLAGTQYPSIPKIFFLAGTRFFTVLDTQRNPSFEI